MKLRLALAASFLGLLAACGGRDTGRVSLLLTDASGTFKAAVVTITEIDLVGSEGTTVLSRTPTTTDLLTLANDTQKLVDAAVVPTGTYSQLRFVISGGYVEVPQSDGSTIIYASSPTYEGLPAEAVVGGTLQMPSYGQSGLKVDLPGGGLSVGTDARVLLVDFDVGQSFGQLAGGSGMWVLHPVLTATEFELSGTVNVTLGLGAGVALPTGTSLAQFSAVLTNSAGSSKTLALVAAGGTYGASFPYLIPGNYTLSFTAPTSVTSFTTSPPTSPDPAPISVASGQATTAGFTLTAVH